MFSLVSTTQVSNVEGSIASKESRTIHDQLCSLLIAEYGSMVIALSVSFPYSIASTRASILKMWKAPTHDVELENEPAQCEETMRQTVRPFQQSIPFINPFTEHFLGVGPRS